MSSPPDTHNLITKLRHARDAINAHLLLVQPTEDEVERLPVAERAMSISFLKDWATALREELEGTQCVHTLCSAGHALEKLVASDPRGCDICNGTIDAGKDLMGCRMCPDPAEQMDVCQDCADKKLPVADLLNSYNIVGDKTPGSAEWLDQWPIHPTLTPLWSNRSLTAHTCRSVVETLVLAAAATGDDSFVQDATGCPYFGTTTVFISYTWSAVFADLIETLSTAKCEMGIEKHFFWIDIFAVNQCCHTEIGRRHNKQDVEAFEEVIATSQATWLHASPWIKPRTIGRVWCLFESLKTIELEHELKMIMSAKDDALFLNTLCSLSHHCGQAFQMILQVHTHP